MFGRDLDQGRALRGKRDILAAWNIAAESLRVLPKLRLRKVSELAVRPRFAEDGDFGAVVQGEESLPW